MSRTGSRSPRLKGLKQDWINDVIDLCREITQDKTFHLPSLDHMSQADLEKLVYVLEEAKKLVPPLQGVDS
jgi:hypothetical protein